MAVRDGLGNECNNRVRVHLRAVDASAGPSPDLMADTQRVYGPHGIAIELVSARTLPLTAREHFALRGIETGCYLNAPISREQEQLHHHGRSGALSNDVVVYSANVMFASTHKIDANPPSLTPQQLDAIRRSRLCAEAA